jgi:hypothetical protein
MGRHIERDRVLSFGTRMYRDRSTRSCWSTRRSPHRACVFCTIRDGESTDSRPSLGVRAGKITLTLEHRADKRGGWNYRSRAHRRGGSCRRWCGEISFCLFRSGGARQWVSHAS